MSNEGEMLLAIRTRGDVRVRPQIQDALKKLRLGRNHSAIVVKNTPAMRGMINKVKDYVTWGEIDSEIAEILVRKRGRLSANRRLSDEYVKEHSEYKSMKDFSKALAAGEAKLSDVKGLKPLFRLSPPSGGYRGKINEPIKTGGVLGYRGPDINNLAKRMI
ncbi:MAG: 50S ribosomal protein L30 [Candidatus Thorarchaeota archaeon]